MSILLNKYTKVIVQGITGTQASFHTQRSIKYGTNIVGGVVPNKKDDKYLGVPLFSTVAEAKACTGATTSLIFVPANYVKSAILEAIHAELELVVVVTSCIPVSDMMEIKHELKNSKTILIGPNTPGIIVPDEAYLGTFPDSFHSKGRIGVISRSSTLTYEVVMEINRIGLGVSTVVGIGDDFIIGSDFTDILDKFNQDNETDAVVVIGGLGGNYETEIASYYQKLNHKKPIIALLLDNSSYLSDFRSIASEIICRGVVTVDDKRNLLRESGINVVDSVSELKNELIKL